MVCAGEETRWEKEPSRWAHDISEGRESAREEAYSEKGAVDKGKAGKRRRLRELGTLAEVGPKQQ